MLLIHLLQSATAISMLLALAACSSHYASITPGDLKLSDAHYKNEWIFNADKFKEPQRCLALSGGGIRSSAYSMGVLKGLKELV